MQAPRADIFNIFVDTCRHFGNGRNTVIREIKGDIFCSHKSDILFDQAVVRLNQNMFEIIFGQCVKLNPDWQTALKFRKEIGWLGNRKRARRNEKDMISFNVTMLGGYCAAFNKRQQITLHSFAANFAAISVCAASNFIDLVDEDNTRLFSIFYGFADDAIFIK